MSRFRPRRPPPQLLRASTIQKSSHEVAVHWWHYRHHFLEARLAQLAERQQSGRPSTPAATPRSVILLHDVPPDDRAVFEQHVAQALADAQAAADPHADPDQVEADTLVHLIAEAEGTVPGSNGWGLVPEVNDRSYDVHPLPTSDPRTTAPAVRRRRPPWRTVALAGGVLAAGLLYSGLLLRGHPASADAATTTSPSPSSVPSAAPRTVLTPTPLGAVWDAPLDALRPTSLEIRRGDAFVLPIDAVPGALGGAWTPPLQPGRAAWLEGSIVNLVLCLAPADHALITGGTAGDPLTLRIANGETRQYVARTPRVVGRQQREVLDQRRTALTLIACGMSGNDRHVLDATLADPIDATRADPAATAGEGGATGE